MAHFAEAHPRARKEHRCDDCGRTIRPGEKYRRGVGMDGATAWTWKECAHCEVLVEWLYRIDAVWGEGHTPETFAEWDPVTINEWRLKVGWRRKWTRRDGSLMDVPVRVMAETSDGWPYLRGLIA